MKPLFGSRFIGACVAVVGLAFSLHLHAGEAADRISALRTDGVQIESIEEHDGYVDLSGTASDNPRIAALMRAIDAADIGSPQLQVVMREGNVSRFELRVRLSD